MRPRHLTLALVGLASIAALLHVLLGGDGGKPASPAPMEATGQDHRAGRSPAAGPAAEAAVGDPSAEASRERLDAAGTAGPAPANAGDDPQGATGFAVAGQVRFDDDDSPAAGASFVIRHPAGRVIVQADPEGRFRTEAVVAAGVAQLAHRPTGSAGEYPLRLRFARPTRSLQEEPGGAVELTLRLQRPEGVLTVRVVHLDGRPAAGARVEAELRREVRPDEYQHSMDAAVTGEQGEARFSLFDLDLIRAAGLLASLAADGQDRGRSLVSSFHTIDPPRLREQLSETVVLVLDAAGGLLVRVRDGDGLPAPGENVVAALAGFMLSDIAGEFKPTDQAGEVRFDDLPAGSYRVYIPSGPGTETSEAVVEPGRVTEVGLSLPARAKGLAAAGKVVDEQGAPLAGVMLHARFSPRDIGELSGSAMTDADGRFVIRAEPCLRVTVRSDRDVFSHEYEPVSLEVPYGTDDLLFTRARAVETQKVQFEILDALSGERLEGALVMTYRAPNRGNYAFHRADDGLASPSCPLHPGTTLVIDLAGFRRQTMLLSELLTQEPADGLRSVRMTRGLLRRIAVEGFDAADAQGPVAGASVYDGGRLVGRTDAAGELLLDLFTWPEAELRVEAPGYLPADWPPNDSFAELEPAYVWLERG